jgi:hypothetical protein
VDVTGRLYAKRLGKIWVNRNHYQLNALPTAYILGLRCMFLTWRVLSWHVSCILPSGH